MSELRDYLHETQTTLAALARHAGVSAAQMSRVASGKSAPSPSLARRLESLTGGRVNAVRLLGLETDLVEPAGEGPPQRSSPLATAVAEAQRAFGHRRDAAIDETLPPRPLGGGRWGTTVAADGSLSLPPEVVGVFGFKAGESLVLTPEDGDMRINSSDQALHELQETMRKLVPPGVSLADELMAERRAEAARE